MSLALPFRLRCGGARAESLQSRRVRIDGLDLHARVSVGPVLQGRAPVVLVHGLGMSSRYMIPLAQELASEFGVHAPDLPGFGLSEKPDRVLDVSGLAEALARYTEAAGIARAAFIGNSLGCEILVEFALRYPMRVERLVLQGPTPDPRDRSPMGKIAFFAVTGLFEKWSLGWIAVCDYFRGGVLRYVRTFRDMVAHRIEHKLPQVQAPALIVWGTRDYIVPRGSVERFAQLLPKGRLVVVPGAAHGMNYSHPRAFRDAILPFLLEDRAAPERPPSR